jgi:hypothetical protein
VAWALVLLCALALPAGARASTCLPPAFDLSTNGSDASEVQVAMDSAGDALAVWVRNGIVQSAFRPAGGTNSFGGATDMPGASTVASHLRLAMDGNGDAVAIWQTDGGRIEAAYMPQGNNGSFDGAQTLETDAANKPTTPDVAIDPAGDAIAVWQHSDGANQRIEAVYAASGTFLATTPQVISPSGHNATSPSVGMDAAGDAQAVWLESDGADTRVQDAERPSGNASVFAALPPISDPGFDTANPRLAVSGGGAAMAVWEDTTDKSVVSAYTAALGATFGTPQTIELDATHPPALPAVAMNDNGDAQAVWQHFDTVSGKTRIEERSAPGGTLAGTTVTVSGTSDDASNAQIAMDGAGDAIAVWAGSTPQIHAAQHISGQEFATATQADVSASGGGASAPSLAIDSAGDGIAGWQRSDGTNVLAQANGYDTGPQIPTLHVPTTPYSGHAVTLYAQGSDVWSPISTTTWNFGDGGTGNGPAVVHTYTAGSHTATATVTVADGLTQSANGSLTVATRARSGVRRPLPARCAE